MWWDDLEGIRGEGLGGRYAIKIYCTHIQNFQRMNKMHFQNC